MVFHDKFELLALHNGDREIALAGREILSGQPVVVHLLPAGQKTAVQDLLRRIPAAEQRLVLDSGDHEGIPYVVTAVLPGNAGLENWIASLAPTPAPSAPGGQPGEFTSLFIAPPQSSKPVPVAPQPGPGEFTRLFAAPREELSAAPPPSTKPGAFTRMLEAEHPASQPPAATSEAIPAPQNGPSEFTRMFAAPAPPAAIKPNPQPEPPPQPQGPAPKSKLLLIVILAAGLFLAVVILILFFSLSR